MCRFNGFAFLIVVGMGLVAESGRAQDCTKYARNLSAESFREVPADPQRMGTPECLAISACYVIHKDAKYHVDVGVRLVNNCTSNVKVAVYLPKKLKGSTAPNPESVASKLKKDKSGAGSRELKPGEQYMFGTISPFASEIPLESILVEIRP